MVKKYLVAGLLVWAPIWVTYLVINFLLTAFDKVIVLLPQNYQPDVLFKIHIPGLGLIIILLVIFFTGMLVSNFLGDYLVKVWEKLMARIPLVRSIYSGVKQILSTVFGSNELAFRKVVLIEYPRAGSWTIAFQTGSANAAINAKVGAEMISVYVPTTPNPTSGYLLFVPAKDVIELNMSVDAALKMVISLGVITPIMEKHG